MKKILLVGKFDERFKELNTYLSRFFSVQICVNDTQMIGEILQLNVPDLVIISFCGVMRVHEAICNELGFVHPEIPVVCVDIGDNPAPPIEYIANSKIHMLQNPTEDDKLLELVCGLLGVLCDKENGVVIDVRNGRKLILLVDDSPIQLRAMREILKEKYDVQMATSGMKALTLIGKRVPDVIFLDYDMPVCDGRMTLEMIRNLDVAKNVPVVFLTGVRDKEHIEAVLKLKPAAYLLKPVGTETIFDILDNILDE